MFDEMGFIKSVMDSSIKYARRRVVFDDLESQAWINSTTTAGTGWLAEKGLLWFEDALNEAGIRERSSQEEDGERRDEG